VRLGVSNRCYVQRADIDLSELTATLVRPVGNPNNNTYWLDSASTSWGIFQWNQTTAAFTNQIPTVITSTADLQPSSGVPLNSLGNVGNFAVVSAGPDAVYNLIYYKRGGPSDAQAPGWLQDGLTASELYNTWVLSLDQTHGKQLGQPYKGPLLRPLLQLEYSLSMMLQ
jgi:hypothetical protein